MSSAGENNFLQNLLSRLDNLERLVGHINDKIDSLMEDVSAIKSSNFTDGGALLNNEEPLVDLGGSVLDGVFDDVSQESPQSNLGKFNAAAQEVKMAFAYAIKDDFCNKLINFKPDDVVAFGIKRLPKFGFSFPNDFVVRMKEIMINSKNQWSYIAKQICSTTDEGTLLQNASLAYDLFAVPLEKQNDKGHGSAG